MNKSGSASARLAPLTFVCCVLLTLSGQALAGPYMVYDPLSGRALAQRDAGKPWYSASLTKLMTAYLVFHEIKSGRLKLDDRVTMSARAATEPPSKLGLPQGRSLSLELALKVLIVRSANDVAVAIAERVAGSVERFVRRMNRTAKRLDMTATHFANPNGLPDPRQITTARDMAILGGRIVREFPQYDGYFSVRSVKVGRRALANRNTRFLDSWKAADGLKTGYVCNSGSNLVASATVAGRRFIAVVLGARKGNQSAATAKRLLEEAAHPRRFRSLGKIDFEESYRRRVVKSGTPIDRVKNRGFSAANPPKDMTPVVCRHRTFWRTIRPDRLREKWTVSFGARKKPGEAYNLLRTRLLNSLNVVHGGNHGLIRQRPKGNFIAVLGNLSKDQAGRLCNHFKAKAKACDLLSPGRMNALAKKDDAHRAAEAKRKAVAKKRCTGSKCKRRAKKAGR